MQRLLNRCLVVLGLAISACGSPPPVQLLGAYRLEDGQVVSVRRSSDDALRYRLFESGRSGRLYKEANDRYVSGPGFSDREPIHLVVEFARQGSAQADALRWQPADGPGLRGTRIGHERSITFESEGTSLTGRLHIPEGPGPHPGMVLVHGSGKSAGSEWLYNGDFMVAHGIAVLAFDKRGTGRSKGDYTFDFYQLARDVVAAIDFLRAQPEVLPDRVGLSGYSQGAWVAPLAASMSKSVACVLVSYGLIESPAEEAWMEMRNILVDNAVAGNDLKEAEDLVRAAVNLVANGFDHGWAEFETLKKAHRGSDWARHLRDTPVGGLLRYPKWAVKLFGRRKLPPGLPWDYDSTALLDSLDVPMAWFLAEADRSAPNAQTIPKLRRWQELGKPFELHVYPHTDHGMLEFDEENGKRIYTGYARGYFRAEVQAARDMLLPPDAMDLREPPPDAAAGPHTSTAGTKPSIRLGMQASQWDRSQERTVQCGPLTVPR